MHTPTIQLIYDLSIFKLNAVNDLLLFFQYSGLNGMFAMFPFLNSIAAS